MSNKTTTGSVKDRQNAHDRQRNYTNTYRNTELSDLPHDKLISMINKLRSVNKGLRAENKQLKQQIIILNADVAHKQEQLEKSEAREKYYINKSPKRKRKIADDLPLKSNSIFEPLNKKQKYDKDDQKEDEQYIEHIDEYDSELMSRKSEPVEQPQ
eukprot:323301_1